MEKNATEGNVFKTILLFSLPFLLSTFLQTLYGLADLFIIGQFCETESTTAVSGGSQVMHMLTVMIVGLAMGSTVLIGKAVGARNGEEKNRAIGNTVTLFAAFSLVLTAVLLLCVRAIVGVLDTPAEAVEGTVDYLTVCFIGVPFITVYNVFGSIFRGLGDTKTPMRVVALACVCNIGLDYLFIGALGLGATGAALGTTLSQAVSVLVAFAVIAKRGTLAGLTKSHFRPVRATVAEILKVGLPVMAQDGFIQISFLLITVFANRRGLYDAAAVGVVEKLIGILFLVPSTLLSACSALCAQNVGAKKHDRARATLLYCALLAAGCGLFFSVLFQFLAPWAVSVFRDDAQVIRLGAQYMRSYVWDCIFAGIHFTFSGYFCAYSHSGVSFLHNVLAILLARIPLAYFAAVRFPDTLFPMGCAAPAGSLVSVIVCVIAYTVLTRKGEFEK